MTTLPARSTLAPGPAWLTFIGVALLLATVGVVVLVVNAFIGILPLGVIDDDGGPGDRAITSIDAPGSTVIDVAEPGEFTLYLVQRRGEANAELTGRPIVLGPGMSTVRVTDDVSMTTSTGGYTGRSVATFSAREAGDYTVNVPGLTAGSDASVIVATGVSTGGFIGGVFGTIGGVFLAILLGFAGFGLTLGGAIWWAVRRGRRSISS